MIRIETDLEKAYEYLSRFEPENAKSVLSGTLKENLGNSDILKCLTTVSFWIFKKEELSHFTEPFEQAEHLLYIWKEFLTFTEQENIQNEQCLYSVKKGVFNYALNLYQSLETSVSKEQEYIIFAKIGFCHKQLGNYEKALEYFKSAYSESNTDSGILAETADCYALCGDERMAKLLFREAFFIDPQKIDLQLLESDLFVNLYKTVCKKYKNPDEIAEWIPVEGVLLGVFSVKRELTSVESGKLKQKIFALENEAKSEGARTELLNPKLINHYFWLIDHYIATNDDKTKITENLLKIKILNNEIFERYSV